MKIEGIKTAEYNVNITNEVTINSFNAKDMMDGVSFGSSVMGFLSEEMNNSSILANEEDAMESLKNKAAVLKDNLTSIFNKMGTGTVVKMDEEGIDVNNTDTKELVTVVEQIQIKLATYCEDFEATVNIDAKDVASVIGQGAAAYEISKKMSELGMTPTKESVSEALEAFNTAMELNREISDGTKSYLMKNNMQPSIKNLYIAEHANAAVDKVSGINNSEWQEILPQVEKIITDSGMEVNEESVEMAKWLVDRELPVNKDELTKLDALTDISHNFDSEFIMDRIVATMMEGLKANRTLLTGENLPWEEAVKAIETINNATPSIIMNFVSSEFSYNLNGLREAENLKQEINPDDKDEKYIKATRQLWEIRLMMTINAGRTLEKNGININTLEISKLVEELRNYEADKLNDTNYKSEDIAKANTVLYDFMSLKSAPAATIGAVIKEGTIVNAVNISQHGNLIGERFKSAGIAYEALSTEIRRDLGDNISKAVKASTGDILAGLGLNRSFENERAVRILAYNEMEITHEQIDKVKAYDASINTLFDRLNPECTLKMLQDEINPLEMPVDELAEYLLKMQEELRPREESFAEFLYKLDQKGEIEAGEREKFIGIYSMVNMFSKDGMNAVGSLINQGLELNMGNLMTAYYSRRDKGMDISVDNDTPVIHVEDKVTYYRNLFAKTEGKINPDVLEKINSEMESMTPEEFVQEVVEHKTENNPIHEKIQKDIEKASNLPKDTYKFIVDNNIFESVNNVLAADEFLNEPKKVFDTYDKETGENSGEELLKVLDDKEELIKEYQRLVDNTRKLLDSALVNKNSYVDMEALRMMGRQINMVQTMSSQNYFCIPFSNEKTEGIIHLKVVESSETQGVFNIRFNLEDGSSVTIEGKVSDTDIKANIMCQNEEAVSIFEEKITELMDELNSKGFESIQINVNKVNNQPDGTGKNNDKVATRKIFGAAKIFISNLTK